MVNSSYLKVLAWNANSINFKMLELQKFNDTENFDIICISETKVADKHSIKLPSYDCYRLNRTSQWGGVPGLQYLLKVVLSIVK